MTCAAREPPRAKSLARHTVSSKGRESRLEVDETRERHAEDKGEGLLPVAPNMEAGGSHLQATAEEEQIVDWAQDLREIRRMVEFLVRRERKLDAKADVAVRRLERLEREHSQLEDEEREASLQDALADRTKVAKLVVDKWFVDKGFGFGKVLTGEVVFIHASVVQGAEVLTIGTDAWVQVMHDDARAQGGYRACKAWGHAAWRGKRQGEGKQSGRTSKTSSSVDGRAGSPVGEEGLRGMQPSSGLARRAGRRRTAAHQQPLRCRQQSSSSRSEHPT